MRLWLALSVAGAEPVTVSVDADPDATVESLAAELSRVGGAACDGGLYVGGRRLAPDIRVADCGLLDGDVVRLGDGPTEHTGPSGTWRLLVTGGPDAGQSLPLARGAHALGRDAPPFARDRSLAPCQVELVVSAAGVVLRDLGPAGGTLLDGEPVSGQAAVGPGQVVGAGDSLLSVERTGPAQAALEPAGPGGVTFVRPPRLLPVRREVRLVLPAVPRAQPRRRLPLPAVLAPLVLGAVMGLVTRNPLYLLLGAAGPVLAVGSAFTDRRVAAASHREDLRRHAVAMRVVADELAGALRVETARRRAEHPDPATTVQVAVVAARRLWERRPTDPDALVLRVGTSHLPAEVALQSGVTVPAEGDPPSGGDGPPLVRDVPVLVPLSEVGVLAVAGPAPALPGLLRWLVVQLAVHHAPRDLCLTVLTTGDGREWSFVRWLPHARPAEPDGPAARVGNDPDTTAARVGELAAVVAARRALVRDPGSVPAAHSPAHVLVVDGFRVLRTTPGLAAVLRDGPQVGVYAVCADRESTFLPETARATVLLDGGTGVRLTLHRSGHDPVEQVLTDQVGASAAEAAARALAPLRDSDEGDEAGLPGSVRLLDLLGLDPPTVTAVRARWRRESPTTSMVLGAGVDGPFRLDLRRDGPHGLVAGTTGAGKSELLQSMIASLAASNRPDELNLVLVDYKGGSAFKDCAALPHTVGLVTDLDSHLVRRALVSLGAELQARERTLAAAGAKDLEDYLQLRARGSTLRPLPRLLIVIDEFAALAKDLPAFVTGLVSIAQRGRSLGLHLLLATQRPSGVVSPEIRANTDLRLALRVTEAADSTDVVGCADAARLPRSAPGRAVARLGPGPPVPFQVGRVGGRAPGGHAHPVPSPYAAPVSWARLGYPRPQPTRHSAPEDGTGTDLSALVAAIRAAAAADGLARPPSPWLPPLPGAVLAADLGPVAAGALALGLADVPGSQRQDTACFDPARDGHLLVVGSPRSGRSQLLRTLACSMARDCSPADLHVYGLDCGSGALLPLQDLPHCGAVVTRTQTERACRLRERLRAEVERRQFLLGRGGYGDVSEQRRVGAAGERLPRLLLMLDGWEGFTSTLGELDGGRLTELVLGLLREGATAGVHLVVTGDRSLASGRIASLTARQVALRLHDRLDYALLGLDPRSLPDTLAPGRAFTCPDGTETQVALLCPDDSGQAQAAALSRIAIEAAGRHQPPPAQLRPFRVDPLPTRISLREAVGLLPPGASAQLALVGVGGNELQAMGPDFASSSPSFVVAGPPRSGRSTVLEVMARTLLARGTAVLLAAPRPGPLRALVGDAGVLGVMADAGAPPEHWRTLLATAGDTPVVVMVDDAELLRDVPASPVLLDIVRGAFGPAVSLVLAGGLDSLCLGLSGWQVEARKARQGLLLSPQGGGDGDLVGVRLPRSAVGLAVQPGRGLLHLGDGRLVCVVIPTA